MFRAKPRARQKVFFHRKIYKGAKEIGSIHLVQYILNTEVFNIELYLDCAYRGKGIMAKELKKYLIKCRHYEYDRIVAHVEKHNVACRRLLRGQGFNIMPLVSNDLDVWFYDTYLNVSQLAEEMRAQRKDFTYEEPKYKEKT